MAILSHQDYNNRWTAPGPQGFNQIGCPPCFHEYLQREIYKQDYLDLFQNKKTFERIEIDHRFYVKITGCYIVLALGVPENEVLTIINNGELYLLVDYAYPWTDKELEVKRWIKYVMIGEAAPSQQPKTCDYGQKDINNSFYYNITHTKSTGYFTAPLKAFNIAIEINNIENKKKALLELANEGSVLFDLFSYSINYQPIRDYLNLNGVTRCYFAELLTFIENLSTKSNDVQAVFVAPPKISYHLACSINNIPPFIFRVGVNEFNLPHYELTNNNHFYCNIPNGTTLNGIISIAIPLNSQNQQTTIQVPKYICCAYSGAGTVPHTLFIQKALNLI